MTTKVKVTLKKEGKREVSKLFDLHSKELAAVLLRRAWTGRGAVRTAGAQPLADAGLGRMGVRG